MKEVIVLSHFQKNLVINTGNTQGPRSFSFGWDTKLDKSLREFPENFNALKDTNEANNFPAFYDPRTYYNKYVYPTWGRL